MPSIPKEDLYALLDLSSTAAVEEIKKQYRKISREVHPDLFMHLPEEERNANADRFKLVGLAYEWLSDPGKRAQYDATRMTAGSTAGARASDFFDDFTVYDEDFGFNFGDFFRHAYHQERQRQYEPESEPVVVPEPETISYQGAGLYVVYDFEPGWRGYGGRVTAVVSIDMDDAKRLADSFNFRDFYSTVDFHGARVDYWSATIKGKEQFQFNDLDYFMHGYKMWQEQEEKKGQKRKFNAQLLALQSRLERLRCLGRPVDTADSLVEEAGRQIYRYKDWRGSTFESVTAAIRAVEKELDRIEVGGTELLLNDLLEGRIFSDVMAANRKVVNQVNIWSARTGNFIDQITEDDLRDIFARRIAGMTTVDQLARADLSLSLEDYAPQDVIDELDHAPDAVQISGRKSASWYKVMYGFVTIDGETVPVGAVSIPLNVYERSAAEYGKKSSFPDLGFGIRLLLHVVADGKEIARGFDDVALAKRVTNYKQSKHRGKNRPTEGGYGFDLLGHEIKVTPPPPWYKGARVRA